MKIKTVLGLLGVWISISAIVAFYVTASLTLSAQSERDYNALLDNAANNHAASVQLYITALQGSFASLSETLSQTDDRTEQNAMIIAYAENRSNVAFIGINRFLERVGDWNDDYDRDAMSARAVNLPQSGNVYLFAFNDNPPTRDYGLAMCAPIGNDRNNTLIVVYYSDVINNMNDTVSLPADGKFALYDSGGNVTCGNRLGAIDERGMTIRRADIADTGWQAAAVGDVKSVRNIAGDALDGLLILTVALCVGGIIATFLICRKFANPLVVIAKAGEQFRRGDFTVRMEFSGGNARNEYGEVAARFNDFADMVSGKTDKSDDELMGKLRMSKVTLDALTSVMTKESIIAYVEGELAQAGDDSVFVPFAIMYLKIDDFADFNDEHSHASGDLMLRFTAKTLQEIVGEAGKVGRYGGDEFIAAVTEASNDSVKHLAAQVSDALEEGYTEDTDRRIAVEAKIGFVVVNDLPVNVEDVIKRASA